MKCLARQVVPTLDRLLYQAVPTVWFKTAKRWQAHASKTAVHSKAQMPTSVGPAACVGSASLELHRYFKLPCI